MPTRNTLAGIFFVKIIIEKTRVKKRINEKKREWSVKNKNGIIFLKKCIDIGKTKCYNG